MKRWGKKRGITVTSRGLGPDEVGPDLVIASNVFAFTNVAAAWSLSILTVLPILLRLHAQPNPLSKQKINLSSYTSCLTLWAIGRHLLLVLLYCIIERSPVGVSPCMCSRQGAVGLEPIAGHVQ